MKPKEVFLSDYKPPIYSIFSTELSFSLSPKSTRVKSKLNILMKESFKPGSGPSLILSGESLKLISIKINGFQLEKFQFLLKPGTLEVPFRFIQKDNFVVEIENEINPAKNTALEGLYISNGIYCTQCEPEGFRKITYYLDRPDVLAKFKVRIEGDHKYLLSNGNLKGMGNGWAEWEDPWPKPSYLFALVAGELKLVEDKFVTRSGKEVVLQIYVEPGDESKCDHALNSLKHCMEWDEMEYNREYDLDRFMIVAIRDFNMGAMENKGLNIFNSKYILADKMTATDSDYEFIERITNIIE